MRLASLVAGSATHQVWVTMDMLEKLFDDRPELLKPGQKKTMIFELCKMCFFEYEVYEQWTNDGIDGREMELTPVNPPKVTKYRHNEKWHIDQLEVEVRHCEERSDELGVRCFATARSEATSIKNIVNYEERTDEITKAS